VVRSPADDERRRHGEHSRRHALQLAPSPLRRQPHRRLPLRRRAGDVQVGRIGDRSRRVEETAQQAPVADRHDDDRAGETDDELKHRPEELVLQFRAFRPAAQTVVAVVVDVEVEPVREHDDDAGEPRNEADNDRVTRGSIST